MVNGEHGIVEPGIRYGEAVLQALNDHRPVVALESTIISHGLPRPRNIEVAWPGRADGTG